MTAAVANRMFASRANPMLLLSTLAHAQDVQGDYLNLSFTGDGESPSALEWLAEAAQRAPAPLAGAAGVSPAGDASYSIPIAVPPARLAPAVTLAYGSGGGLGRVGRGWSLDVGPTIRRPLGREAAAYDDVPGVHLVAGAGFSGMLVPDEWPATATTDWRWVSTTPGAVIGEYDPTGGTWTLARGGVTWTFEPTYPTADFEHHAISQEDSSGNRVDYAWLGSAIDRIEYGGTSPAGHFLAVQFEYTAAIYDIYEGRGGVLATIDDRLRAVRIETSFGHASFVTRHRYDLDYAQNDELLDRVTETEVLPGGTFGAVRDVASFTYTTRDLEFEEDVDPPTRLSHTHTGGPSLGPSESLTWTAFVDASSDALPDVVSAFGEWEVGWQLLEQTMGAYDMPTGEVDRSWEDVTSELHERPFDSPGDLHGSLDESSTVVLLEDGNGVQFRGTYALRRFLDLDGDGYQDVVETSELPCEWSSPDWVKPCESATAEADNAAQVATTWTVW